MTPGAAERLADVGRRVLLLARPPAALPRAGRLPDAYTVLIVDPVIALSGTCETLLEHPRTPRPATVYGGPARPPEGHTTPVPGAYPLSPVYAAGDALTDTRGPRVGSRVEGPAGTPPGALAPGTAVPGTSRSSLAGEESYARSRLTENRVQALRPTRPGRPESTGSEPNATELAGAGTSYEAFPEPPPLSAPSRAQERGQRPDPPRPPQQTLWSSPGAPRPATEDAVLDRPSPPREPADGRRIAPSGTLTPEDHVGVSGPSLPSRGTIPSGTAPAGALETYHGDAQSGASRLAGSTGRLETLLRAHVATTDTEPASFDGLPRENGASLPAGRPGRAQPAAAGAVGEPRSAAHEPFYRRPITIEERPGAPGASPGDAGGSSPFDAVHDTEVTPSSPAGAMNRVDLEEVLERLAQELEDGIARTYGSSGG